MKTYLLSIFILMFCGAGIEQAQKKTISSKEKPVTKSSEEKPIPTLKGDRYVPRIVYKDEWILFADSEDGTFYLNPSKLMLFDGIVYSWEKMIPSNPISYSRDKKFNGSEVSYLLTYREVDCKKLLSKTRTISYYAKDGTLIKLIGNLEGKRIRVKPNSVEKKSLIKACSYEL